jgi:5-methylcytosine-specific restriction endonuclease McrA
MVPVGYHHTAEWKAKVSAALRGRKFSDETRRRMSAAKMNHAVSDETRRKMSEAQRGRKHPPEVITKIAAAARRLNAKRKGIPLTPEVRTKISRAVKGKCAGAKNGRWRGGLSRLPYGWEWTAELREEVRTRDGHKCRLCGVSQAECIMPLNVHHINYSKTDNDPLNLITLCQCCHSRTNSRRRYWQEHFEKEIERGHTILHGR